MSQLSVTGTATLLVDAQNPSSPCNYVLYNAGSATVYVGSVSEGNAVQSGTTVLTTSTGLAMPAGATLGGVLGNSDALYGITAGTTVTMHRLRTLQ